MTRVAIQGEPGSYSECAALDFFAGEDAQIVPCRDYPDLFRAVNEGTADCMVIPIENSAAGSVYPYYDLLLEYATEHGFRVVSERKLRIRHNLIAHQDAKLEEITEVWSHFQALDQCRVFLQSHGMRMKAVYDTAGAVQEIAEQGLRHVAAVGSAQAAADNGMKILARNITNHVDNYTRFLRVEKNPPPVIAAGKVKATVVFCIANREGSLFRTLAAFGSRRGVGIIRMECRPLIGTLSQRWSKFTRQHGDGEDEGVWDLLYYLDFLAPAAKCDAVLEHLSELVLESGGDKAMQLLGCYDANIPLRDITGEPWRKSR